MTIWISDKVALAIHDEQLAEHGGASGVRDLGLLESALARPLNLAGYGKPDTADLGAAYAIAITRNHPFVDGNKRTAFMAMVTFLDVNGMRFEPPDGEAVLTMLGFAAGQMADEAFTEWVRTNASERD